MIQTLIQRKLVFECWMLNYPGIKSGYTGDKIQSVMLCLFTNCLFTNWCIQLANILLKFFSSMFMRDICLSSCNYLVRFGYQDNTGLIKWDRKCFFFFNFFLEEFVLNWYYFFPKCLVEFTSDVIWVWSILCEKVLINNLIYLVDKEILKYLYFFLKLVSVVCVFCKTY